MFLRSTASAIASASTKSFLLDFSNGLTNCAAIKRTSWPCLRKRASEKMRPGTCLQPDQRGMHIRGVCQQLSLRELLPHQHLAGLAECDQVKRCLAKIDADRNYLHMDDPP